MHSVIVVFLVQYNNQTLCKKDSSSKLAYNLVAHARSLLFNLTTHKIILLLNPISSGKSFGDNNHLFDCHANPIIVVATGELNNWAIFIILMNFPLLHKS